MSILQESLRSLEDSRGVIVIPDIFLSDTRALDPNQFRAHIFEITKNSGGEATIINLGQPENETIVSQSRELPLK